MPSLAGQSATARSYMTRISRRSFIGGTVIAATTLRYGHVFAASGPDLVDVHGTDHDKMIAAAFDALGGIKKFVHRGDYVVLKPNGGFANPPDWGTTTHPATVVAVAKACLAAKAKKVVVVEHPLGNGKRALKRCGLTSALAGMDDVELKLLSGGDDFSSVAVKGGKTLKSVEVAKAVLSADVMINLPAAKSHSSAGVSFGMKNLMGVIRDRRAFHSTHNLDTAIADLSRAVRPNLTILDATRALLTNGPAGPGETAKPGRMVASRDIVAVDAYGLTLARFNRKKMTPADARHIELAGKFGIGQSEIGKLKVKKVKV